MPPRKRVASAEITHEVPCTVPRVETYVVEGPGGKTVRVTRCQECGAHIAE